MIIKFDKADGKIVGFTISDGQESAQGDCLRLPSDITVSFSIDCNEEESNAIYNRLVNRVSRTEKVIELGAPSIIIQNEKRLLQEAVDGLAGFIASEQL